MAPTKTVHVHPLVLLSVVDHYHRVAKETKKRVVGVLLGSVSKDEVDVTNSFAVPFEEDAKDPTIWFMDHSYMENMSRMFRKVNAREYIVGWYSTGPKLKASDLDINDLMSNYCSDPVLVITEVQPKEVGLPVHAYVAREEVKPAGTEKAQRVFQHLPTSVRHTEVEEIGVEHLLKDVKDATISTLSTEVAGKAQALKGLKSRLGDMLAYLSAVVDGKLPVNNEIIALMQDMFNLLPNLNISTLSQSLTVTSNDMMMSVYLASILRTVVALHSLIENKESRATAERKAAAAEAEAHKKDKDGKDEKEAANGKDKDGGTGGDKEKEKENGAAENGADAMDTK